MNEFKAKLIGFPKAPSEPFDLTGHEPTDDQLKETLNACKEAHRDGVTIRFQPLDIGALVDELLWRRATEALRALADSMEPTERAE